ncbi:hypothetical protein AB0M95_19335 [Sphaerisporangium sp. NPDC051017]|uniref:hypothetical protein n=1 Tax=Sphaerisporangium sp. NPDC051017 TaxID=3154636 RepID=UPI003431BDA2
MVLLTMAHPDPSGHCRQDLENDVHFFDAADVPETDHWEAWLAYADLLTGAGDLRGEAIRLEHHCEIGDGDPARLAAAYAEVERQWGLDGLREDGSWRLTWSRGFIDEACFRLAKDTQPQRRELVERLLTDHPRTATVDLTDPEQWEGALIDVLLSHPAAHRLRALELHLTDYHRSAEHSAISLAGRRRPRLERMYFGYDFEYLYEDSEGSTGNRINPLDYHHKGLVQADVWDSLPALRTLELEGAFLFHFVKHDSLTRLRARGPVISDGSIFDFGWTTGLQSLEVEIGSDVFGCLCPVEQLDELKASKYPNLENLDLSEAEFDDTSYEVVSALADSSVLPLLRSLSIRDLTISQMDCEGDPLTALAELAPRFGHLDLYVGDVIDIEDADDEEVDRVLSQFGLSQIHTTGDHGDD